MLVRIPPLVWHGFMAVGNQTAVVLNLPTEVYQYNAPDELRRPVDDSTIPFEWHRDGW
jgi:dTDP-4-dehydrorhamnose 3,5-epimerase